MEFLQYAHILEDLEDIGEQEDSERDKFSIDESNNDDDDDDNYDFDIEPEIEEMDDTDEEEEEDEDDEEEMPPERMHIIMPSSLGWEVCVETGKEDLMKEEISLRKKQAYDALEEV